MAIPSSRNWRSGTGEGASHIRSVPRAVLGNGMTSRIEVSPARIMTRRSKPRAMPPCGGAPYSSASSRKPKRRARFVVAESQRRKDLGLHVAPVNTNRARGQLHAVQHQVVGLGSAMGRVGGQLLQVLVMHRSERVVCGGPAALFLVPFEHREIHHPQETADSSDRAACGGR